MDTLEKLGWSAVLSTMLCLLGGCAGVGRPAPDFKFTTLSGEEKTLSSYKGQPVVVDFWGTDCVPCMAELPRFQEAYTTNAGRFELILLSDSDEGVKQYVSEHGFNMTFAVDHAAGKTALHVGAIPHTFFIDRLGRIKSDHAGEMTGAEFNTQLQGIL